VLPISNMLPNLAEGNNKSTNLEGAWAIEGAKYPHCKISEGSSKSEFSTFNVPCLTKLFLSSSGKSIQYSPTFPPPLGRFEPLESISCPTFSPLLYKVGPFLKNYETDDGK